MNYPQTASELVKWPIDTVQDGRYTITAITGYEGTGKCYWCGKELNGRKGKHYCQGKSHGEFVSCYQNYVRYFCWPKASSWCIKRYEHHCAVCGKKEGTRKAGLNSFISDLEIHHIVPLKGGQRLWSPFNVPWNLICLCHPCHMELHQTMRENEKKELFYHKATLNHQSVMRFEA